MGVIDIKKVCIITQALYGGGAERAAANLSKDLSDNYQIYLIVYDASRIDYPYSGELIDCKTPPKKNYIAKIINFIKRCLIINRIKKKKRIDVSISFMTPANVINIVSKYRDNVITSVRNTMSMKEKSKIRDYFIRWCGKKTDYTVALSEGVKRELIYYYNYNPYKLRTIYNSCDYKWFYDENPNIVNYTESFSFDGFVLVTAGRLTRQKGQWHLIRAVSILKKEIKNIKLVIFGDGDMLNDLQEYANTLDVSDCVFFPGYMKNYHYFMKKCDAFVFSSLYEGFGNVLIEALSCGLPIVSVDAKYGPREILSNSNHLVSDIELAEYGILTEEISQKTFDRNDINFERSDYSLAKGISVLLKDEKTRMHYVVQAKRRSEDFSPDKIISQWNDVIG